MWNELEEATLGDLSPDERAATLAVLSRIEANLVAGLGEEAGSA